MTFVFIVSNIDKLAKGVILRVTLKLQSKFTRITFILPKQDRSECRKP